MAKKRTPLKNLRPLLYRVILASSNPGDVVLDPFFGSGTTGAVAKKLHRNWIGIELEPDYIEIAKNRLDSIIPEMFVDNIFDVRDKKRLEPRIPFATLLENGLLNPGQALYFQHDRSKVAHVKPDGNLVINGFEGSIHQVGRQLMGGSPCNGWDHWYYESDHGKLLPIDDLRQIIRDQIEQPTEDIRP